MIHRSAFPRERERCAFCVGLSTVHCFKCFKNSIGLASHCVMNGSSAVLCKLYKMSMACPPESRMTLPQTRLNANHSQTRHAHFTELILLWHKVIMDMYHLPWHLPPRQPGGPWQADTSWWLHLPPTRAQNVLKD